MRAVFGSGADVFVSVAGGAGSQGPSAQGHPLRAVRAMVRAVPGDMHGDFARLHASAGRPSIPPEQLLSALLLQVFYGIRSERQLMEQLDCNLLYRGFVGLDADAAVWAPTTFTKNRERP